MKTFFTVEAFPKTDTINSF